ncbi:hypothetical protein KEK_09482 [Mycolicibacterium thermoresistibile ATCC 19527]|uniref:Uncharacterized protein n=1 Tax=Mycolicibacterium thermoresistibile (strain ATCC 19527 / DSM 44167 / CIP 105390 / JCM 6362 / NCTC 10409 / 316) TaxID=1078020 RepID=G7CFX5_MYCT3|nr:hypothetical protein KEK_09482 [Mycolicibacterium thermoresistibile ATCC 19527]
MSGLLTTGATGRTRLRDRTVGTESDLAHTVLRVTQFPDLLVSLFAKQPLPGRAVASLRRSGAGLVLDHRVGTIGPPSS